MLVGQARCEVIRLERFSASPSLGQRALSLSAAAALNCAAVGMLLMLRGPSSAAPTSAAGSITSISIAAVPIEAKKTPPRAQKVFSAEALTLEMAVEAIAGSNSPEETSGNCPITEDVAKGILADATAVDAIIHAPAETRSIADAIVIWNAGWTAQSMDAQSPLGPVRTNVTATLQTMPEDCLSSTISGPRLIAIPNGEAAMILVFGSGDWSWKSLIEPGLAGEHPAQAQIDPLQFETRRERGT